MSIARSWPFLGGTFAFALLAVHVGCSSEKDDASPAVDASSDAEIDVAVGDAGASDDAHESAADAVAREEDAAPSVDCSDAGAIPDDLACTGLYASWGDKTLATGVEPYTPGYVLWSDGAAKSRFIALPAGSTIDTSDANEWTFPVGTRLWKEFRLGGVRIETRAMWKTDATTWTFAVYRWSSDEASARRITDGETNVDGTTYEIPKTQDCILCHGGRKDKVLGFDAVGLGAERAAGLTLAKLVETARLTAPPKLPLTIPEDASGKAREAFGWLHANCGIACHNLNPHAAASVTGLVLRIDAQVLASGNADGGAATIPDLLTYTTSVNVAPTRITGLRAYRIHPHDVDGSLLPLLDETRGDGGIPQMPPIYTHVADTAGVASVKAWINAMP